MNKQNNNSQDNYLSTAKNYKTLPPEKQKELFNYINFSVAQNTKIPFANYLRQAFTLAVISAIAIAFFIFSEKDSIFEIVIDAAMIIGPLVILMYKLTQKKKEDII